MSASGDRYVVTQPNSVVDVAASQVLLIASSLEDAYVRRRQQLPHDTAEAHLALAEWCLRYELLDFAGQELAAARRLDPHARTNRALGPAALGGPRAESRTADARRTGAA